MSHKESEGEMKSLGQVAFDDFHSPIRNNPATWERLGEPAKGWWESAALAVVAAHEAARWKRVEDIRQALSGADVEAPTEKFAPGDNLSIVLCTYFSDHLDRPEGDEETEETSDHMWGEWVEQKCDEALSLLAKAVSEAMLPPAPGGE